MTRTGRAGRSGTGSRLGDPMRRPGPSALSWTSEGVLIVDGAPSEMLASMTRASDRDPTRDSPGVLCLSNTCVGRGSGSGVLRPRRLQGLVTLVTARFPWPYPFPEWAGAFLRFHLQRFPPSPMGARLRVPALLSLGPRFSTPFPTGSRSRSVDFRASFPTKVRWGRSGPPILSWFSVLQGIQSRRPPQGVPTLGPPARFRRRSSVWRKGRPAPWGLF